MNKKNRELFFTALFNNNPKPRTELIYSSHFELLIAVILSAQATDKSVNIATKSLYQVANTPENIHALGESGLKQHIKSIGLFNTKARNIISCCKMLIEKFNSQVPDNMQDLIRLPGVGRKTANVILNTAFKQPTMAVDTHVFRVANRTGLAKATTPLAVEKQLLKRIPANFLLDAHHWLILHGRYVCTAINPKCHQCQVFTYCGYKKKHVQIAK